MTDKVQKIREKVARLQKRAKQNVLTLIGKYIDTMQEEPVSEDLVKCTRKIILEGANFNKSWYAHPELAFKAGAKWQKENLWNPADGDDLPIFDREVIALLDNGKVVFAHRPNPEGWDAKSIITEKVEHYTPETYDKGGWNIPDVKWWLDCLMPKEIEL